MIKRICRNCQKLFEVWPYQIKDGGGNYCSSKCLAIGKWKHPTERMIRHIRKAQRIAWKKRIGMKHTKKTKKLISDNRKGKALKEKNSRWNGGIGSYRKYIKIEKCEGCGSKQKLLYVHHKDKNRHNNLLENLKVLCPKCHYKEHEGFNRWKKYAKR
jgi:5-methylcytosine-specific restriction endonuclease McrA